MDLQSKIKNRNYIQQIKDFSGLKWGNIYPTDIDGFFEMDNKIFVFIELKFKGVPLQGGQGLAFERLVDMFPKEKNAIFIIARHDEPSEKDIDAASCKVMRYRFQREWKEPKKNITVKELCDKFIKKFF